GFEWTREAARRPYVINEVMYSNGIMKDDVEKLNRDGFLPSAIWAENRVLSKDNQLSAGQELFVFQCYSCHTINGINNDIVSATKNMSYRALVKYIQKIHEVRYFMPPFAGTEEEGKALAAYIAGGLHGKEIAEQEQAMNPMDTGKLLFEDNCSACHEIDDMVDPMQGIEKTEIGEILTTLNEISDEMEPFSGTDQEKNALTDFLNSLNKGVQ
ncbi:MAG: cytochrome c, partial [Desulfobulbaceae bacterium]|nr:cytochrome c [Desulfobulbaceae bacterium]